MVNILKKKGKYSQYKISLKVF